MDAEKLTAGSLFPEGSEFLIHQERDARGIVCKQVWAVSKGTHVVYETRESADALLDANKAEQALFSQHSRKGSMMKVASVPTSLVLQWDREQRSPEDRARFLNDPDNAKFRTTNPTWRV